MSRLINGAAALSLAAVLAAPVYAHVTLDPPHAAADIVIPSHPLPEVQQHRPGRIGCANTCIIRDDFLRQDWRTVTFPLSK